MKSGMITRQLNPLVASKIIFSLAAGSFLFSRITGTVLGYWHGCFHHAVKDDLYFCSIGRENTRLQFAQI